jgi:DNA repair protein RadC
MNASASQGPSTDGTGHRARLRGRLLDDGGEALLDHELIEYLLALAIPRRDTKPLAKALLHEFGGLGGLLSADPRAVARVPGMGAPPSPRSRSPMPPPSGCCGERWPRGRCCPTGRP